jgi:hypothetical protein
MSIGAAYTSGQRPPLIPARNAEELTFSGGRVVDMALLSIMRLAPIDHATSALAMLARDSQNPLYRCPKEACAQLGTKCGNLPFCGPSLRVDDALLLEDLNPGDDALLQLAGQYKLTLEAPAVHLIDACTANGNVRGAVEVLQLALKARPGPCHVRLSPFQVLFGQRTVLPRTSTLAYWGVGTGKTAGAAAVLLQAGAAVRLRPDGTVSTDALPVHFWGLDTKFQAAVGDDAQRFAGVERAAEFVAIKSQLRSANQQTYDFEAPKGVNDWLRKFQAAVDTDNDAEVLAGMIGNLVIPDVYVASLVLMNEAHRMNDDTYNLLKAVNLKCLFGGKTSPGLPPVIAAFTGTPCGAGLRGLVMTLDLLDNAVTRAGERRTLDVGVEVGNTSVCSLLATHKLMSWLGLAPYQTARVGDRVSLWVQQASFMPNYGEIEGARQWNGAAPFHEMLGGDRLGLVSTIPEKMRRLISATGTVVRIVGNYVVEVQVDASDGAASILIRVPTALTAVADAPEGAVQAGRPQMLITQQHGCRVVDRGNPNDLTEGQYVNRPLTLIHGPDADMESELMNQFGLWGKLSYVDLSETPMFPTRVYEVIFVPGTGLTESVLPELIDPLALVNQPGDIASPAVRELWKAIRNVDMNIIGNTGAGTGLPLTNASTIRHTSYYSVIFYAALLAFCIKGQPGWTIQASDKGEWKNVAGRVAYNDNVSLAQFLAALASLGLVSRDIATRKVDYVNRVLRVLDETDKNANATHDEMVERLTESLLPAKVAQLQRGVQNRAVQKGKGGILAYVPYPSIVGLLAVMTKVRAFVWAYHTESQQLVRLAPPDGSAPPVVLVSDVAGSDDLDSSEFRVDKSEVRPDYLVFVTAPPSRQRMVQAEGRLHRSGCDASDLSGDPQLRTSRTINFALLCSDWRQEDSSAVAERIGERRQGRSLAEDINLPEAGGTYYTSTAWERIMSRETTGSTDRTPTAKTFDAVDFIPLMQKSRDAQRFMELQAGISDYTEFFASLAQQFSIELAAGDDAVLGKAVEWTALAEPMSMGNVIQLCNDYILTFGTQNNEGERAHRLAPGMGMRMQQDAPVFKRRHQDDKHHGSPITNNEPNDDSLPKRRKGS